MSLSEMDTHGHYLFAILGSERLARILRYVFDSGEFPSGYGLRSLSKVHARYPYEFWVGDEVHTVRYEPAEWSSGLFGGN